jgi:predicted nucleic acid-binding protein
LIVDASALVASLGSPKSERLLFGEELAAPDLLIPETLNTFWKLQRAGRSIPALSVLLRTLDHIRIVPSRAHAARAAELADQLDHPVYDCLYLALAEVEGDVLLTADTTFERKTRVPGLHKRVRLMLV